MVGVDAPGRFGGDIRPFSRPTSSAKATPGVEVGDLEAVDIGDHDCPTRPRQRHEGSTAHAADAADEHPPAQQLLLALVDEADIAAGEE